jgi:hypothetical protein
MFTLAAILISYGTIEVLMNFATTFAVVGVNCNPILPPPMITSNVPRDVVLNNVPYSVKYAVDPSKRIEILVT